MSRDLTPVKSGFMSLDSITKGFFPGELTVVASRSGEGKTAFIENIMDRIQTKDKSKILFFSAEGKKDYQDMRLASMHGKIPLEKLKTGILPSDSIKSLGSYAAEYGNSFITIDDTPFIKIDELCEKASRLCENGDFKIIFVDYLGVIGNSDESKPVYERVHEAADKLKKLSRELEIPVVVTCELSKGMPEQEADMSLLRGSGAIEDIADVVILLDTEKRDEEERIVSVNVAKNRNGKTGKNSLRFIPKFCLFEGL